MMYGILISLCLLPSPFLKIIVLSILIFKSSNMIFEMHVEKESLFHVLILLLLDSTSFMMSKIFFFYH